MAKELVSSWKGPHDGYTPGLFRWEVLGECRAAATGHMEFWTAYRHVLCNQPYQPNNPPSEVGNFHRAVAAAMGVKHKKLKLYTAVGSPLARYGISGFFRFSGRIVAVDAVLSRDDVDLYEYVPPHHSTKSRRVVVHADDAAKGYPKSAAEIAYRFKLAKLAGKQGFV